jgi:hypothetical protein
MDSKYSRIVFSTILVSSFSFSLDISKYNIGTLLDVTKYDNNQYSIEVSTNNKPIYYTPTTTIYDINYTTKYYKSKFGDIILYDLSKDDRYLNAIDYNYIKFSGFLDGCRVAISDKSLFHKEDNILLSLDTNNSINLKYIYNDIDLSRLKYIVLFQDNKKCYIDKIRLEKTNKNSYITNHQKKALWIWNPKNKIDINKLKKYNINKTYIQIKDGFETLLGNLNNTNIAIFGLNGSPKDIYSYQHLKNDIKYLSHLKLNYQSIVGYQIDVEPYLLKEFKTNKDKVLKSYIDMLSSLSQLCHKHNLKFSVVIPFWFDNIYYQNINLAKIVVTYADEVVLMSYRSDLDKVIDISKHILAMGDFSDKKIYIGIELMPINDEKHTIYKVIKSDGCLTKSGFLDGCKSLKKIREYTIKGTDISFYNQYHKLNDIDKKNIPFKSFQGFVLHYYDVLP